MRRAEPSARQLGASVENDLDTIVHPAYYRAGLATLWHEGQRCIWTSRGPKVVDSRPDYGGVLQGGRAITFDAKHCAGTIYHHQEKQLHQLFDLWQVHERGGLAGVLVVNQKAEVGWWLLPQPEWELSQFYPTRLEKSLVCWPVPKLAGVSEWFPDWLGAALE